MRHPRLIANCVIAALLIASIATADDAANANAKSTAQGGGTATLSEPGESNANASVKTATDANAGVDAAALKRELEQRSQKASAKLVSKAETHIDAEAKGVDAEANGDGGAKVAARLAQRFGMTTDAMMAERSSSGASWGQLMIAHTLAANSKTDVTASQLLSVKGDGMGWGRIAAGMGFELGSAMKAVDTESRVAMGKADAAGHVAVIHGQGARAGIGSGAGMHAGVNAAGVKVGGAAGAGVKIGH